MKEQKTKIKEWQTKLRKSSKKLPLPSKIQFKVGEIDNHVNRRPHKMQ